MEDNRVKGIPLSGEDEFYPGQAYREPVERIARFEEAAKFLAGATATTSGLYLAAYKISMGKATSASFGWILPFLSWSISLILLVLVLLPAHYGHYKNDPPSIKAAFQRSGRMKYSFLFGGVFFFVTGILLAVLPFSKIL